MVVLAMVVIKGMYTFNVPGTMLSPVTQCPT
jgi:hypothetical protein